jgi:uncharacterized membrane protein
MGRPGGVQMAYCANCGALVEGQFCQKCGTAVGAAAGTQPAPTAQPGLSVNAASALCYLFGFITGIVFLAIPPYNHDPRVRFHAFQSIFLSVGVIALHFAITFAALMFQSFSLSLGLMVSSLHLLVSLGFFLVWLYMMWKCSQGVKVVLPLIGPLAERQAGAAAPASTDGTMGRAA